VADHESSRASRSPAAAECTRSRRRGYDLAPWPSNAVSQASGLTAAARSFALIIANPLVGAASIGLELSVITLALACGSPGALA